MSQYLTFLSVSINDEFNTKVNIVENYLKRTTTQSFLRLNIRDRFT